MSMSNSYRAGNMVGMFRTTSMGAMHKPPSMTGAYKSPSMTGTYQSGKGMSKNNRLTLTLASLNLENIPGAFLLFFAMDLLSFI